MWEYLGVNYIICDDMLYACVLLTGEIQVRWEGTEKD
jgi:hypothetical protein